MGHRRAANGAQAGVVGGPPAAAMLPWVCPRGDAGRMQAAPIGRLRVMTGRLPRRRSSPPSRRPNPAVLPRPLPSRRPSARRPVWRPTCLASARRGRRVPAPTWARRSGGRWRRNWRTRRRRPARLSSVSSRVWTQGPGTPGVGVVIAVLRRRRRCGHRAGSSAPKRQARPALCRRSPPSGASG